EWLRTIKQRTADSVQLVQVVAPGHEVITENLPHICSSELLTLAAAISKMDLFVAADSGPMHLAAASGTPTIGLFRATSPEYYAPLCPNALTLTGTEIVAEQAAMQTMQHLQL